jgi:hypothetical protein
MMKATRMPIPIAMLRARRFGGGGDSGAVGGAAWLTGAHRHEQVQAGTHLLVKTSFSETARGQMVANTCRQRDVPLC